MSDRNGAPGARSPAASPALRASGLGFAYPAGRPVLAGVDLTIAPGDFLGIVGPNGAGKSTLLHLLSGVLNPGKGSVDLDGRPIGAWRRRDVARVIGVVPQGETSAFPFRVREVVLMGRTPYLQGFLATESAADLAAARHALDAVGIAGLADRPLDQLSGGERQMVLVARALAQQPRILLLDEPTASLDLAHQQRIFRLLVRLNAGEGLTVVVVTHDLNLASLYCARLAVLHGGRIAAEGQPAEIMKSEFLSGIYDAGLWSATSPAGAPIVGLTR